MPIDTQSPSALLARAVALCAHHVCNHAVQYVDVDPKWGHSMPRHIDVDGLVKLRSIEVERAHAAESEWEDQEIGECVGPRESVE